MPSMADYAASGGYAKDAQASKNLSSGNYVGGGNYSGGSSSKKKTTVAAPAPAPAPDVFKATTAPSPAQAPTTDFSGNPLGGIADLKKLWETNQMDGTTAANNAAKYYDQLSDYGYSQDEVAKIRDMDSAGVAGYNSNMKNTTTAPINANIQNTDTNPNVVTTTSAGRSVNTPNNTGQPTGNQPPNGEYTIKDTKGNIIAVWDAAKGSYSTIAGASNMAGSAAVGAAIPAVNQLPAGSTSNDLMKMFTSAIKAAGNPGDAYWKQFQDLADTQADGILKGKQQQLDTARSGIDDQFFQQYLKSRQGLSNRGLGNSGLANDSDFRLQLAKQGQLADMYTKMGSMDKSQISADQFKGLYDSSSKTLLDKANSLQQAFANTSKYDKIDPSEILKTLYNYDHLGMEDKWKDQDAAQNTADLTEKARQFDTKLDTDKKIEMAKLGFDYKKLNDEHQRFYDKLDQDQVVETAKLDMEMRKYKLDVSKTMGYVDNPDGTRTFTLDANKLLEEVRHNKSTEGETGSHDRAMESVARQNASTSAQNASTNAARLKEETSYHNEQLNNDHESLSNSLYSKQADIIYNESKIAESKMDQATKDKEIYLRQFQYSGKPDEATLNGYDARITESAGEMDNASIAMKTLKRASTK